MTATPGGLGFLARYDGLRARLPGADHPAVLALRDAARALLHDTGLPSRRVEAWRYTDLAPVWQTEFREALLSVEERPALPSPRAAARAVFLDGRFRPDLSTLDGLPWARSLAEALPEVARHLTPPDAARPVEALNTMLFEDGLLLDLPAGVAGGDLELLSLATGPVAMAFHPRHLLRLGAGASLTLLESASGPPDSRHLHNPVFDIVLGQDAVLTHVRAQHEPDEAFHLAHLNVRVAAGGRYDGFTLNAGARVARCEIHLCLEGPHAQAHLNGAQLAAGRQVADITTSLDHAAPSCSSRQTVRTVLSGRARGVFQGRILVRRPAQKTDGYQMNQALLLSETAEMDSKPQLEIYADDVKCSHGATVGALDADQLFYLRSRGIAADAARAMLVRAFLDEAVAGVPSEPGRAVLEEAIAVWWLKHGGITPLPAGEVA